MTSQKEAFEKFRDGYVSDQDRKPTAFETWQAAIEDYKASLVPVAWMWQHEETGNIGFIDQWQMDNGFEKGNPRLSIISPVYKLPSGETK